MKEKKILIDSYIKTRPQENDTVSETYRGGANKNFFVPFVGSTIKEKRKNFLKKYPDALIDFYVHIPFCFKKCSYCFYYKEVYDKEKLEQYLIFLHESLLDFAEVFAGYSFKSLYIGGGTPTVLSPTQMDFLLGIIHKNYSFREGAQKTYEGNPFSFTDEKIQIMAQYGINRISMGVQSLDSEVLALSKREYQTKILIQKTIHNLHAHRIHNINFDLIIGLKNDTREKTRKTLIELIEMKPFSITIYWLGPTDGYVKEHYEGNIELFYQDLNSKIKDYYDELQSIKEEYFGKGKFIIDDGNSHVWTIDFQQHLLDEERNIQYVYDDFGQGSLFSIGPTARSHIYGELVYENIINHSFVYQSDFPYYMGMNIDKNDEMALFVITKIRDNLPIVFDDFFGQFGLHFKQVFETEILFFLEHHLCLLDERKAIFSFDLEKKMYYSLFFVSKKNLIQKNIMNSPESNRIFFEMDTFRMNIVLYYDEQIKIFSHIDYNLIDSKNIKIFHFVLKEVQALIEKLNNKGKGLNFGIIFIRNFLDSFQKKL